MTATSRFQLVASIAMAAIGLGVLLENEVLHDFRLAPNGYVDARIAWVVVVGIVLLVGASLWRIGVAVVRLSLRALAVAAGMLLLAVACGAVAFVGAMIARSAANLAAKVFWGGPDREAEWWRRTAHIADLVERHGGFADGRRRVADGAIGLPPSALGRRAPLGDARQDRL